MLLLAVRWTPGGVSVLSLSFVFSYLCVDRGRPPACFGGEVAAVGTPVSTGTTEKKNPNQTTKTNKNTRCSVCDDTNLLCPVCPSPRAEAPLARPMGAAGSSGGAGGGGVGGVGCCCCPACCGLCCGGPTGDRIADYKSPADLIRALKSCGVLEDMEIMVGVDATKSNEMTGTETFAGHSLHDVNCKCTSCATPAVVSRCRVRLLTLLFLSLFLSLSLLFGWLRLQWRIRTAP
jgi:hypothetical protein